MKFITNWLERRAERHKARLAVKKDMASLAVEAARYNAQIAEEERADRQTTHAMYLKVGIDTLSPHAWQQQAEWMLGVQEDVRQLKLEIEALRASAAQRVNHVGYRFAPAGYQFTGYEGDLQNMTPADIEAILNPPGSAVPQAPVEVTAPAPKRRGRPPKAKPHA